jgi:tetratricopeptide (TPR) repeat protein
MKTVSNLLIVLFLSISAVSYSQENIDYLLLNREYENALQQIELQIKNQPKAELFFKKGLVYNQMQKYREAIDAFSSAKKMSPDNSEILEELSDAHSLLGNYYDARDNYEKAVELDSTNLQLLGKLGRNYISLKNYQKGYQVFDKIFQVDSTNVYWNKQFAYCAYQTRKKKDAIHLYEKVLELNPRDYSSYFNLLRLYATGRDNEKILALIENGLQQFPNEPDFYLERANFQFGLSNYDLAMPEFENYYSAGGDSIYKINMNYAISCYFAGDEQKALKVLRSLYAINPDDSFVLFYRSLCNKKLANYEEAEKFMEGAIDMSYPTYLPEMYHHLGQILGQQRKFEKSIVALKKAYELDPKAHEVLFEIATTYEEYNSNKTLALNYYRLYLKEAGEAARNVNYALDRIERIKEDMFFEE